MRITHIGPDSEFVRFASEIFESVAPGANEYIIVSNLDKRSLRFPIRHGRVRVISPKVLSAVGILSTIRSSDMVIAHSMTPHAAIAFSFARRQTIKVWSGWGFDYYGNDSSSDFGLLGDLTLELASGLAPTFKDRSLIRRFRHQLSKKIILRLTHRAASKSDYFSAIPEDLTIFRGRFPKFNGSYAQLNYSSVVATFARGDTLSGSDILVGNSASFTNNHLEAFDLLAQQNLSGRRIVVPLSYGEPSYREAIVKRGNELFGSAFTPLVDLLPLDEYVSTIAKCSVVIMNHKRQQALGNIGAALYHGAHVFLDEGNPTLNFFRSRGAVIYSLNRLNDANLPNGSVPSEDLATNRRVLDEFFGEARIVKNVEELIGKLDS